RGRPGILSERSGRARAIGASAARGRTRARTIRLGYSAARRLAQTEGAAERGQRRFAYLRHRRGPAGRRLLQPGGGVRVARGGGRKGSPQYARSGASGTPRTAGD